MEVRTFHTCETERLTQLIYNSPFLKADQEYAELQGRATGSAVGIMEPQRGTQGCCCPEAPTSWAPLGVWYPGYLGHCINSLFHRHSLYCCTSSLHVWSVCCQHARNGKIERTEWPRDVPREWELSTQVVQGCRRRMHWRHSPLPQEDSNKYPHCHSNLYLPPRREFLWGLGKSHSITRFSGKAGG